MLGQFPENPEQEQAFALPISGLEQQFRGLASETLALVKGVLYTKGGEKTVVVPENVPVLSIEPADRSLLTPGTHVIVYATPQADGMLAAERVSIGKNGYVPPL